MGRRKSLLTADEKRKRKTELNRGYRHRSPEVYAAYMKRWKENQKRRIAAMTPEQRAAMHKKRYRGPSGKSYYRSYQTAVKLEMLNAYGLWCACCGENEPIFLTIDHINGDGAKERKLDNRGGYARYLDLKKRGWPPGYQVLCFNCNIAKRQATTCPHKTLFQKLVTGAAAEETVVVLQRQHQRS